MKFKFHAFLFYRPI